MNWPDPNNSYRTSTHTSNAIFPSTPHYIWLLLQLGIKIILSSIQNISVLESSIVFQYSVCVKLSTHELLFRILGNSFQVAWLTVMPRITKLFSRKERNNNPRSQVPIIPAVSRPAPTTGCIEHNHNAEPLAGGQEGLKGSTSPGPLAGADKRTEKYGLFRLRPSAFFVEDAGSGERNFLDIVAVHGITGGAYDTWEHGNNLWLQDLIPKEMPGVRVFSYGYPAEVFCTLNTGDVETYARSLLEVLKGVRRLTEVRIT